MTSQLEINFREDNLLARADQHGLWISTLGGWIVPISISLAKEYANKYGTPDQSANHGFFDESEKVVLTHNQAKFSFSRAEAAAIIDLINTASREVWVELI